MKIDVNLSTPVVRSARVMQLEGMFDLPPTKKAELHWSVDLPLEDRHWNIGLIVGPSGSGKSTVARHLWPQQMAKIYEWPSDKSVLDAFPKERPIKDIVGLLTSVGFSSPPAWMRPFGVLSTGEQFRTSVARVLAETQPGEVALIDEYTSVVDRTVAQIGSAAVARAVRGRDLQLVAVTCHEDVIDWLQPDWSFRPDSGEFAWRGLQRRPPIELSLVRASPKVWRYFSPHHYLTADIHPAALCCVAFWRDRPVVFVAAIHFMHAQVKGWRHHRLVCLPDYQGVGLGVGVSDAFTSALAATGYPIYLAVAHPASVSRRSRSPLWELTRQPSIQSGTGSATAAANTWHNKAVSRSRMTASFKWVGPPMDGTEARKLLGDRASGKLGGVLRVSV